MDKSLVASSTIEIKSQPERIWKVLTDPEMIKIYLFGTEVHSDWKEGSPISFSGNYDGKTYEDKGNVLQVRTNEHLKYNYWTGFSGLEDQEENYSLVSYSIQRQGNKSCAFTWHQEGFSSEEGRCHTEEGLKSMLKSIKELAEGHQPLK